MSVPSVLSDSRLPPSAQAVALALGRLGGRPRAAFDVCHAGVVLRTVLFSHGAVTVALLPGSEGLTAWLAAVSWACTVVLPGTLVWLLAMCAGQAVLARWPRWARWTAALVAGTACGAGAGVAWSLLREALALGGAASPGLAVPGAAVSGAALATGVVHWLEQRVRMLESPGTAARLAELQSRIRPHFLFNAINSAIALVEIRPEQAEQVLEDLATLFRAALDDGREQVDLGEELALARRYLAVEQVRFAERLQVRWEVDPAAARARVPPLVLQPLVENAIKHGVEEGAMPGEVQLTVRRLRGDRVEVRVRNRMPAQGPDPGPDPGAGPSVTAASAGAAPNGRRARRGLGMALANVRERLHLMHDVALAFEAGEAEPGWWQVRIVLPLPVAAVPTAEGRAG